MWSALLNTLRVKNITVITVAPLYTSCHSQIKLERSKNMDDKQHKDDESQNSVNDVNPMDGTTRDQDLDEESETPFSPPSESDESLSEQEQQRNTDKDSHQAFDEEYSSARETEVEQGIGKGYLDHEDDDGAQDNELEELSKDE
jgi:hypothetical protein